MRVDFTNTSASPVTVQQMEQNLRLPTGFDTPLIERLINAATDYIERTANVAIRSKNVIVTHLGNYSIYELKFAPTNVVVSVNGIATTDFTLSVNQPSYVKLTNKVQPLDEVKITYSVTGRNDLHIANEAIIIYASAMYNNPEGLEALDMRRINNFITTIQG
jgi:hypothetical protein